VKHCPTANLAGKGSKPEETGPMSARVPTPAVIVAAAVLFAGLAACQGAPTAAPSGRSAAAAASPDVGAPCAPKTVPFDAKNFDLTGPWADHDEGGIY
jgi:hypothetical protein